MAKILGYRPSDLGSFLAVVSLQVDFKHCNERTILNHHRPHSQRQRTLSMALVCVDAGYMELLLFFSFSFATT